MDADGKQLLYFGSDDSTWEIGFRKVLDAFLERSLWPGWNVRFCPRHLVDFAEALGLESPMTPWLGDAPDLYDLKYWIGSSVAEKSTEARPLSIHCPRFCDGSTQ